MVTIQSQNFGVEIEMTGVSRGTAASVIANYFGVGGSQTGCCRGR